MFEVITDAVTGEETIRPYTAAEIEAVQVAQAAAVEAARNAMTLTFAQLMIGLVTEGWITEAEGDAWLVGNPPAVLLAMIATLPTEQQFPARARAIRPSSILRMDPLVIGLGLSSGKTPEEMDIFFNSYGSI